MADESKTSGFENINQANEYTHCETEREALLLANYALYYMRNQIENIVCALDVVRRAMEQDENAEYYSYAIDPAVRWLEEISYRECKPCTAD